MAVDEVCVVLTRDGSKCLNQDIIFAGTDDGRILKVASLQDGPITTKPLLAEDIAVSDVTFQIVTLKLNTRKALVVKGGLNHIFLPGHLRL